MDAIAEQPSGETSAIAPLAPDWNSIRARYLEGEELASIAADNNTTPNAISIRACREKWKFAQFEHLLRDKELISSEIKNCLLVSVVKEARWFQAQDPVKDSQQADAWSRIRLRLVETASKLLGWDADPISRAKVARAIDI